MVLLSLGFPARSHFERAAQEAMHRFHVLVLKQAPMLLLCSPILSVVFTFLWFADFLVRLRATVIDLGLERVTKCLFPKPTFGGRPYSDFVYDHDLSKETATLWERVGMNEMPVFVDPRELGFGAQTNRHGVVVLFSGAKTCCTKIERRGLFAHELGHFLLPLRDPACFVAIWGAKGAQMSQAEEFAADAIGACLLNDARPLALVLYKIYEGEIVSGWRGECSTHPPILERINRLLDTDFSARHAR